MAYNLEDGTPSFVIEVDFLKGEKGDTGFSPRIEIASLTSAEYILKVINEDGEFLTPNLKSDLSLDDYVLKEEGKGLSTNSFENEEKQKLQELHNYDDTDLRNQVASLVETIGDINSFEVKVVDELPTENINIHTIYFVPSEQDEQDYYDEFLYVNNKWEHIGTSKVDLTGYVTIDDLGKDYTGTNITAPTVEGYGRIKKLYGNTVEEGTGDKSPDNPYVLKSVGDDGQVEVISTDGTNTSSNVVYVGKPLCSIGDIRDELDYTNGKITRKCGYAMLNGTENVLGQNGGYYVLVNCAYGVINAICSHYTKTKDWDEHGSSGDNFIVYRHEGWAQGRISFKDTTFSNVTEFKTHLEEQYAKGTPVTVIYELATPTIEDIDCSDKIVQYPDSTTIHNRDGAEIEVELTNNETVSGLNEVDKVLEDKIEEVKEVEEIELQLVTGTSTTGLKLKRQGNIVNLTGEVTGLSGTYNIVANIPEKYRPSRQIDFNPYINPNTVGVAYVAHQLVLVYAGFSGGSIATNATVDFNMFWMI